MWGIPSTKYRLVLPVFSLICLSLSSVSSSVSLNESSSVSWFRKCCSSSRILSAESQGQCVSASNRATELYGTSVDTEFEPINFLNCNDLENIATTPLDLIDNDNVTDPICIDVLENEIIGKEHIAVVHCRSDMNDTKRRNNQLSLPKITKVRRCCPRNMFYDPATKSCTYMEVNFFDIILNPSEETPLLLYETDIVFLSLFPNTSAKMDYIEMSRGPPDCRRAVFDYRINATDLLINDNSLKVSLKRDGWRKEEIELTEENACVELTYEAVNRKSNELILRLCENEEICSSKPCIVKCCREDQFRMSQKACQHYNASETPFAFHKMLSNITTEKNFFKEDYGVLVGSPCKHGAYIESEEKWNLSPEGYLQINKFETYKHHEYCMDIFKKPTGFLDSPVPFICFDQEIEDTCELRCRIRIILQSISCVFLLITLVVYACLPVLQNLHGKTLMCHVASLFMAFASLVISSVMTPELSEDLLAKVLCSFLGFTMLFSFVAAFAWLNVMCFDIWWTFGGLRENMLTKGRRHRKRFLLYNAYAWGLASLITSLAIAVDNTKILPINLQPRIGEGSCWFTPGRNLHGEVLFFIGPVTIQSIINVILFVLTTIHCNKVKAEINRVTVEPSDARNRRFQANRTKLIMNTKLFIVMGVSWIMEVVSYFINNYLIDLEWREEFFYASDVFNCLQGVLIFALFVLKKRVYHALRKRLGFEDTRQGSSNVTTIHDPSRMKKSVSNSTLMSTFQMSVAP